MRKAFTLIELTAAIAILAVVLSFAGVVFKVGINAHRTAIANAEIMQELRAITNQLNSDFKGLAKDGYLILDSNEVSREEFRYSAAPSIVRADKLYYFSTGDFQSWFASNTRSNITRVYFGHDSGSLDSAVGKPVSEWTLVRDVKLVTPGKSEIDSSNLSYAYFKADIPGTEVDANSLLTSGIPINIQSDDVRGLMCENIGEFAVEWTDGTKSGDRLQWYGLGSESPLPVDDLYPGPRYRASWTPQTLEQDWPKALKFTFMLYDSKRILKKGRRFTHIVYLGD